MASLIRLICPNLKCRKILTVPQSARGKSVRCGNCGMKIHVPSPSPASPAAPGAGASAGATAGEGGSAAVSGDGATEKLA